MGEMADAALDDAMDAWLSGELDDGPLDITCQCCGRADLHWRKRRNKWRLFTPDNELHDCQSFVMGEE